MVVSPRHVPEEYDTFSGWRMADEEFGIMVKEPEQVWNCRNSPYPYQIAMRKKNRVMILDLGCYTRCGDL
jgi:hypothetical protein